MTNNYINENTLLLLLYLFQEFAKNQDSEMKEKEDESTYSVLL